LSAEFLAASFPTVKKVPKNSRFLHRFVIDYYLYGFVFSALPHLEQTLSLHTVKNAFRAFHGRQLSHAFYLSFFNSSLLGVFFNLQRQSVIREPGPLGRTGKTYSKKQWHYV
jgi:hypothetical protein